MGNIADQYNQALEEVVANPAAQKTLASLMAAFGITESVFDILDALINAIVGVFGLYLVWLMIKHRRLQIKKDQYEFEKDQYEFQKIKEAQEVSSPMQAVRSQVQDND